MNFHIVLSKYAHGQSIRHYQVTQASIKIKPKQ
jgi:hypothetical protein